MGRIVQQVFIESAIDATEKVRVDGLVDTGASIMALPISYEERFKSVEFSKAESVTASGIVAAKIAGPFRIQIGNFRSIFAEIAFIEGLDEPLIGYTLLEAIPVAVDMVGHRLVAVKYFDMK